MLILRTSPNIGTVVPWEISSCGKVAQYEHCLGRGLQRPDHTGGEESVHRDQ